MKLSDYVVQFLVEHGVGDIFMVSGGGIMHLCDSVGRNPGMRYYCNYHEQACAIAAEGYARVRGSPGACLVTTGPGGVNAVSGLAGAWVDSIPVIAIVGQVRRDLVADYTRIRQFGPQEGNVTAMARPVTKYAKTVTDPQSIRSELETAFHLAVTGRPGPVLIEIPLDVQGSEIDAAADQANLSDQSDLSDLSDLVSRAGRQLAAARRPLIIAGNGIHLAHAEELLLRAIQTLRIPIVVPYTAKDLVPEDHPLNMGVFGTAGQRRANFAVQNADCILSLGSGLNCTKTGFNYRGFAPRAVKIMVDIDEGQLTDQAIKPDLAVRADAGAFLEELLRYMSHTSLLSHSPPPSRWLSACADWKRKYPPFTARPLSSATVDCYYFVDRLAEALGPGDVLVGGAGTDTVCYYQAFRVKAGQRTMTSGNWGGMGWDLPLSIGACIGSGKRRTVCVTGDGSIQFNIHELLAIRHYSLPLKAFVFNNAGYTSIRTTQNNFFEGRLVGADSGSGVANPDFGRLAAAYGLRYEHIRRDAEAESRIARALDGDDPVLCEVSIAPEQGISPKASAFRRPDGTFESKPLEDMFPFLPPEEVRENMHLFDGEDK